MEKSDKHRQSHEDMAIRRLVAHFDNEQQQLAKKLQLSRALFNLYFNRESPMPWYVAAEIEILTADLWGYENRITVLQLLGFLKYRDRAAVIKLTALHARHAGSQAGILLTDQVIMTDEQRTFEHGGNRKNDDFQDRNCGLEPAAKRSGFRNTDQYYRVKQVCLYGCPELIGALNNGRVSISMGACISQFPKEQQLELLALEGRQLIQAVKTLRTAKRSIPLSTNHKGESQ